MFEAGLPISIYLVNSIAGSIYMQKFLKGRYQKKVVLFAWTSLYFIIQSLGLERLDSIYPLNDLVGVLADTAVVLLLQMLLYQKDLSKQFFVVISFVAGKEIIRYIIVALNRSLSFIWAKIISYFVEQELVNSIGKFEIWKSISNGIIWFICIVLYAVIMIIYLSMIGKKFLRKEYQHRTYEYTFLILPSLATLCISITLKMMIVSVENGMATTIFEKVPATMFWVPLICLLLLGVIIASVILFQKVVQLGEEEKKHAILENQMVQMQREIEEIQDMYADMRGLRHDMRSHLESIAAVIKRTSGKDREELDGYIGSMEKAVNRLNFAYRTGNPITDVIIHQKKQEAEKRQIAFEADFTYPDKRQIDVYDTGSGDRLYVFEAPIDLLSFLSRYPRGWREHSFVALCGTAEHAMLWMLERNPGIRSVCLCLDHDEAGIEASGRLAEVLHEHGYDDVRMLRPEYKDWNEDLKALRGLPAQEAEEHPQLIVAPEVCGRIGGYMEECVVPERLGRELADALRGYEMNLRAKRPEAAMDCIELASALALFAYGRELRQLGEPRSGDELVEELCGCIHPHQNRSNCRTAELAEQTRSVLAKASAPGIRSEAEKRELAESWLELAVSCAKAPVKFEADRLKQQQKQAVPQLEMG